ncbi:MAG: peptidoglycan-binding protein [Planctomycetota bacterium]|jgi:hypothetical protein
MPITTISKAIARGSKGKDVKRVQEWLTLHDIAVAVDGAFGPATEAAVGKFQKKHGLAHDGIVGKKTFAVLTLPMVRAREEISSHNGNLGSMAVRYAKQHLREHPREVGGENRGPWVRLYMNGKEGPSQLWCAGFACHVLERACDTLGAEMPVKRSVSCDVLARRAKRAGIFLPRPSKTERRKIRRGSFFLNRKTANDWVHVGIVTRVFDDYFETIEGNTNDEGSREGYEVCNRLRGFKKKDFILI